MRYRDNLKSFKKKSGSKKKVLWQENKAGLEYETAHGVVRTGHTDKVPLGRDQ